MVQKEIVRAIQAHHKLESGLKMDLSLEDDSQKKSEETIGQTAAQRRRKRRKERLRLQAQEIRERKAQEEAKLEIEKENVRKSFY